MKRVSAFLMIITVLLVGMFFAYKYYLNSQFNKAISDTKALAKDSISLVYQERYSFAKGQSYIFSPGDSTTDLHGQMWIPSQLYDTEINPLSQNDFSVVVPELVDTGLTNVKKVVVHYRRYKQGPLSVDKIEERIIAAYHMKTDETRFTLNDFLQHYGARIDEEIRATLTNQAVANVDEIINDLNNYDIIDRFKQTLFMSDGVDYVEDGLLFYSPLLSTPIKVPYASLFDVIDSQYLTGSALTAYQTYEAEEKARKEAEEAARIEEERQRQLSAFDYGPVLQGQRVVALTFDDGPNPATTPQVLDILARYNAKATFYVLGSAIEGNHSILTRMVQEGHELGNHTWDHPKLPGLSADQITWQFNSTTDAIKAVTGVTPKTFRPPYGATNATVRSLTDMTQMLWTVDTLDWKNRSTEAIMANIQASVHPGGVILMHDIHPTTMNALPTVMDYLVSQGYSFVTISELYGLE